MRVMVAPVMIVLLALLHAPPQAQALLYDFLPSDLIQLGASEPVTLVLTAIALLSLARMGTSNRPAPSDARASRPVAVGPDAATRRLPASTERAA